jgi:nuclear GTP-binding protein
MELYSIAKFNIDDPLSFLSLVARSTGKLKKGGIPNVEAAARTVLHDWNDGKIKYYCKPPEALNKKSVHQSEAIVVPAFSKQLDIDNMNDEDIRVLEALDGADDMTFIPMDSNAFVGGSWDENNDEEKMDCQPEKTEKKITKKVSKAALKKSSQTSSNKTSGAYSFAEDFTY